MATKRVNKRQHKGSPWNYVCPECNCVVRPAEAITVEQRDLLRFVEARFVDTGRAPTLSEMAAAIKITPQGVRERLLRLQERGYLVWVKSKLRSMRVLRGAP